MIPPNLTQRQTRAGESNYGMVLHSLLLLRLVAVDKALVNLTPTVALCELGLVHKHQIVGVHKQDHMPQILVSKENSYEI